MERLTKNNSTMETEVYKCLIENQIEFHYTTDADWEKFIDSLDKETYERYVNDAVESFFSSDVMWEVIDEHIEEFLTDNEIFIKNYTEE